MKLWHGSPIQGLKELQPQGLHCRHAEDPPRVYASPKEVVAASFIPGGLDDSWSIFGGYGENTKGEIDWWLICGDEERFRKLECRGGSLYELRPDNFAFDTGIGLGEHEWYSSHPAAIVGEEKWSSALEAMLHYGVRVCFVPPAEFTRFGKVADQHQLLINLKREPDGLFRFTFGED